MEIVSLRIERTASYETPSNTIVARVQLEGPTGKQEILLSSATMIEIFKVIRSELIDNAIINAKMTKNAVDEAINGPLLEEVKKLS